MRLPTLAVRAALHLPRQSPGTTLFASLALAVGLALAVTVFGLVQGVLLRPLPFHEGDRLVILDGRHLGRGERLLGLDPRDFRDLREAQRSFDSLVPLRMANVDLAAEKGFPERRQAAFLGHEAWAALGVEPLMGPGFDADDDLPGAPLVVMVGERLWRERFAADPGILGRTVRIDGETATVKGVMAEDFRFPMREEIWLPLRLDPDAAPRGEGVPLTVFGRLAPGVSRAAAQAEMTSLAVRLAERFPATHEGLGIAVVPYTRHFVAPVITALFWTLLGSGMVTLLVACVNVSSLLSARAADRAPEYAVRAALGAGRLRLTLRLLAGSLALTLLAAVPGLVAARLALDFFAARLGGLGLPFWMRFELDGGVIAATLGMIFLAAALSGWPAARHATGLHLADLLRGERLATGGGGRGGRLFQSFLVMAETAAACLLLIVAGLMLRTFSALGEIDPGADPERVLTARLAPPVETWPDAAARAALVEHFVERLTAWSGVRRATATTSVPTGPAEHVAFAVEDDAAPQAGQALHAAVHPAFFETFTIEVLRGRTFTAADHRDAVPVAVVNRSLAERQWGDVDVLGRRLRLDFEGEAEESWRTVVGVVEDAHLGALSDPLTAGIYTPYAQTAPRELHLVVEFLETPTDFAARIAAEAQNLDAGLRIEAVRPLARVLAGETFLYQLFGRLLIALAIASLFLAVAGVAGVLAYSTSRRTLEIGVRRALGATPRRVTRQLVREGMLRVLLGLVAGLVAARFITPLLSFVLYGVSAFDPAVFLFAPLLLAAVGWLACRVPARRAARRPPLAALRHG